MLTQDMTAAIAEKAGLPPQAVALWETTLQTACFARQQYDEDSVAVTLVKRHGVDEEKARAFYRAYVEIMQNGG